MSGYHALRPWEKDDSRDSGYELPGRHDDEDDSPIVLARVHDFGAQPDETVDEPTTAGNARSAEIGVPVRSRLAIGGLVLVAGLCGFVLGRVTSPEVPEDPEAWRPAPPAGSAPEAPAWEGQSLTPSASRPAADPGPPGFGPASPGAPTTESPGPSGTRPPVPTILPADPLAPTAGGNGSTWGWTPPPSNVPSEGQTDRQPSVPDAGVPATAPPWSPETDDRAEAEYLPLLSTRGPTTPSTPPFARTQGQHDRRPVEKDPYGAARIARRATAPIRPSVQPNTQPELRARLHSNGPYSRTNVPMAARPGVDQRARVGNNPSPPRPCPNYPTTSYPNTYPRF